MFEDREVKQMTELSEEQIKNFWSDGFLVVKEAVSKKQLKDLRSVFNSWVLESKSHVEDYGLTLDGRARFDLEPSHRADCPALRRVQSPEEISKEYLEVMRNSRMVDFVVDLIGPAIRFHHGKINSKLPGAATKVKFHQDFPFQPMTNDDIVTALLFVDNVTLNNGPLEVVPGSHKGSLFSHWEKGVFVGAVSDEIVKQNAKKIIKCTGMAGSVCLMHSSLLHGSAPNLSKSSRTLYIATYYSEDAVELSPNALPSKFTHELVRGEVSGRVRCTSFDIELPEVPKETSFFAQQENMIEK